MSCWMGGRFAPSWMQQWHVLLMWLRIFKLEEPWSLSKRSKRSYQSFNTTTKLELHAMPRIMDHVGTRNPRWVSSTVTKVHGSRSVYVMVYPRGFVWHSHIKHLRPIKLSVWSRPTHVDPEHASESRVLQENNRVRQNTQRTVWFSSGKTRS